MKKIDFEAIAAQWVGKGKIQVDRIEKLKEPDGGDKYRLHYKEAGKKAWLDCDDRKELDKLLIEFGGKNIETVAIAPEYNDLENIRVEELENLGHQIVQVTIKSRQLVDKDEVSHVMPANCGLQPVPKGKQDPKQQDQEITFVELRKFEKSFSFTAKFESSDQFENMKNWLNSKFSGRTFSIQAMITYSLDLKKYCKWIRSQVGDGSKSMVLKLVALDGTGFEKCMFGDLVAAADGLAMNECRGITIQKVSSQYICGTYQESLTDN